MVGPALVRVHSQVSPWDFGPAVDSADGPWLSPLEPLPALWVGLRSISGVDSRDYWSKLGPRGSWIMWYIPGLDSTKFTLDFGFVLDGAAVLAVVAACCLSVVIVRDPEYWGITDYLLLG